MNIFALHQTPYESARDHCDKHVIKMILETAQLLSTAHRVLDGDKPGSVLYKATHKNHPCAKWVRECSANYHWAYSLFDYLNREYMARYNKTHASWIKLSKELSTAPANIKQAANTTPFALAMPIQCIHPGSDALSYQNYYKTQKREIATWKKAHWEKQARTPPRWWT